MPSPLKEPEDVFTPRSPLVNDPMYVHRDELEKELVYALKGSLNIVVHGESGSGKSWLWKKVLGDNGVLSEVVNLANASRFGSIKAAIEDVMDSQEKAKKTGYSETKKAGLDIQVLNAGIAHVGHYELGSKEPMEACFEHMRKQAGKGRACLILENLDQIIDNAALMKELADMIMLLDDERYGRYAIKLLITSIPSGVKEYFSGIKNLSAVSNRITEIPEVSRLEADEAEELIRKGLVGELGLDIADQKKVFSHICWVTDRIPQRIHEYCLELARIGCDNKRKIEFAMTSRADKRWMGEKLSSDYAVIEDLMNDKETKIGRKNQCLFALGQVKKDEFKSSDIEAIVKEKFPESVEGKSLNVSGILGDLAKGDQEKNKKPILKKTPKGDTYTFKDPKFRMCIRIMLERKADGTVGKKDLDALWRGYKSRS